MTYTFSNELISDLHKDARGYRPVDGWMYVWENQTDKAKQVIWDMLCEELEQSMQREREREQADIAEFERELELTVSFGAGDRATALRWLTQNALFRDQQDIEHWVWERGILFTDEGRQLVKDLMDIVTFQEWEAA